MNPTATIFIIDDDPVVRDALSLLLEAEEMTVETFGSGEAFLDHAPMPPRSCAVVDIRMPGLDGLQLQAELKRRGVRVPLIFLTGHGDIPMSVRAIKAGAVDFLTKPVTGAALLSSIEAALRESDRLAAQAAANHAATSQLASLTEREHQVMLLAVDGQNNKEIARSLGISHRTVEIHKARIMQKTGAETLLDLVRIAEASGTVRPPTGPVAGD